MSDPMFPREDEIGLLGACLLGGIDTAVDVVGMVPVNAVFADDVRDSFALVERLATEGRPCDIIALDREWARVHGNRPKPMDLWLGSQDACPSSANAPLYAQGVLDGWRRRRVAEAGSLLASRAKEGQTTVDELLAEAESVLTGHESAQVEITSPKEVARSFIGSVEDRHRRQGAIGGIETGFMTLDMMSDGLQPGEQAIIAARPSIGKTAIAMNIVEHACLDRGIPTLFVTLEMSEPALMRRLAASRCHIPLQTFRTGQFTQGDMVKIAKFSAELSKSNLHVVNGVSGMNVAALSAVIRRASRKHGVKLVVVDYLQKVKPTQAKEKRTYEVAEVSEKLKATASKTGVAMLTLAQVNRENEKDKRPPRLSDLADSAQIERDADLVALLHRDRGGENQSEAKLIIAKQRDGETGLIDLHFDGKHCRFTQVSHNEHE